MSLKKELQKLVTSYNQKTCPISAIEETCKRLMKKISNGERRLRPSESPNIKAVKNEKGHIIGYASIAINWKV